MLLKELLKEARDHTPEFLAFAYNHSTLRGMFSDMSELEDLFNAAYLDDIDLETLAISAARDLKNPSVKTVAVFIKDQLKWVISNSTKKRYMAKLTSIGDEWVALVSPRVLEAIPLYR